MYRRRINGPKTCHALRRSRNLETEFLKQAAHIGGIAQLGNAGKIYRAITQKSGGH